MTDITQPEPTEDAFNPGTTGEHDSKSQAFIAGLIIAAVTVIAVSLIIAATFNADAAKIIWPIVGVGLGGLISQLNAPTGIGAVIASAAKAFLPK